MGTRLMLSIPPAMKAWPASIWMAPAAMWIACMEEPQNRLMVVPATLCGRLDSMPTSFAMLKPCSPSGKAQPSMMSSISFGSTPVFFSSPSTTCAARSSGRMRASLPLFAKWNGDRTYPAITTFFMALNAPHRLTWLLLFLRLLDRRVTVRCCAGGREMVDDLAFQGAQFAQRLLDILKLDLQRRD